MATIGLDKLYYATFTENEQGEEEYATPKPLAKAISAELSVELAEAILYADDGASEIVKEFKSGTITLGIDDIGADVAADLIGARVDGNKVLVSATEDGRYRRGNRLQSCESKRHLPVFLALPREIRCPHHLADD